MSINQNAKQDPEWSIEERLDAWSERSLSNPIFIVEGSDDVVIYREIAEHRSLAHRLSFEPAGGRDIIFQLHGVLAVASSRPHQLVFFADKDTYVFSAVPAQYQGIHFTNGYSIENDLFEDGRDLVMQKLYPAERERFDSVINSVAQWFAFEVDLVLSNNTSETSYKISLLNPDIFPFNGNELAPSFLQERNFVSPSEDLTERIREGYSKLFRGKFLFQILVRISQDRSGTSSFRLGKDEKALWNDCLAEGLRNPDAATHCNRIASILKEAVDTGA